MFSGVTKSTRSVVLGKASARRTHQTADRQVAVLARCPAALRSSGIENRASGFAFFTLVFFVNGNTLLFRLKAVAAHVESPSSLQLKPSLQQAL
jgi:hypothetical protein